jgi:hypothetical protein
MALTLQNEVRAKRTFTRRLNAGRSDPVCGKQLMII